MVVYIHAISTIKAIIIYFPYLINQRIDVGLLNNTIIRYQILLLFDIEYCYYSMTDMPVQFLNKYVSYNTAMTSFVGHVCIVPITRILHGIAYSSVGV